MVLYLLLAYLAACYLWALYVVLRLYHGRRLRVAAQLGPRERAFRPLKSPADLADYHDQPSDAVAVVGPASEALPKSNAA
jgi:hypothetical protein